MNTLKNLTTIALTAGMIGLGGCTKDSPRYEFDGKIGEEQVSFTYSDEFFRPDEPRSKLIVKKNDGRVIEYQCNAAGHLIVTDVFITKKGVKMFYPSWGRIKLLKKAQQQFENYSHRIDSIKNPQAYKHEIKAEQDSIQKADEERINQALKDLD